MAIDLDWPRHQSRLVPVLRQHGIELDQRMAGAVMRNPSSVTAYLQRTNAQWFDRLPPLQVEFSESDQAPEDFTGYGTLKDFVERGVEGIRNSTFGARDYLRGLLLHARDNPQSDSRSPVLDRIAAYYAGSTDVDLRQIPEIQALLHELAQCVDGAEDYPYLLIFDGEKLRLRTSSVLGDYFQATTSGPAVQTRAVLTHLDEIGFLTSESVREFEELINDSMTQERDLQAFFERHPGFLRQWDHRDVFPQVFLTREESGPLVPDFLLTNSEAQKATLVELKRAMPRRPMVRRQRNRTRFADLVMEARAQLLDYRDWFEDAAHRDRLMELVGMEIYRPRLMVIVGRASDFVGGIDRQRLAARTSDVEIVTYDDILETARLRRLVIQGCDR